MNEYERKREERIARNRAVLERLLISNDGAAGARHALLTPACSGGNPRVHKKQRKAVVDDSKLRRSDRVRRLPAPVYTTFDVHEDLGDHANVKKVKKIPNSYAKGEDKLAPERRNVSVQAPPASANSLRALKARLWDVYKEYLGAPIAPPPGDGGLKAAVVRALSPVSAPKFSKMSGIQEWKNCVALYVNVGDKHGDTYDNVFTHAGSRITWFAQSRQCEDTPVIQRIIKTAALEEESVEDALLRSEDGDEAAPKYVDWPLHLFCRMEGCEYVYCGRLKMVSFEPNRLPMKFIMRLVDAPLLRGSEHFLGLVELADADAKCA